MIKLIGILLIILLGWMVGCELRSRLKARYELICSIDNFCCRMVSMVRFEKLPLDRIISRIIHGASDKTEFIKTCAGRIEAGDHFHSAWDYTVSNSRDLKVLKPDEREDLRRLGRSLGRSDIDGEISLIEGYRNRINPLREAAMEEFKNKGRAVQNCCLLAGIFLAIVIL